MWNERRHHTARVLKTGWSAFRTFVEDRSGNFAMVFALAMPPLFGSAGFAIDYSVWIKQQAQLRAAADAASLAAAKELFAMHGSASAVQSVADAVARANLTEAFGDGEVSVTAEVTSDGSGVEVTVAQEGEAYFSGLFSYGPFMIEATAIASSVGEKICVIGLDPIADKTIWLTSNADLTASNCSVYSNSTSTSGLISDGNALLTARLTCSAGGSRGGTGNYSPEPMTDCPAVADPLASRAAPPVGACNHFNFKREDGTHVLQPGVYCGGLILDSHAKGQLQPGIYVIKDGPLIVNSNAVLEGEYVGFYFIGAEQAPLHFNSNAAVDLGAPKDGPMAGILFFEDRDSPELREFKITSDYARNLLGTIYLPRGRFLVNANQPVADHSAYTVIIARRVELNSEPNLVLNTDYDQTDVPVPDGIGPVAKTRLIR